ncbi:sulfatase-like hydrolase/transferase [Bacillus niameyensis]|uniref:sulfatase-like hydrolase/transferase n=1 Tax=Bacillus niameyensis TaxID=1522308 RepID=UPI0007836A35|nr:sulfatase-like hydrolase/transferase [Bacillus niameyensis]
MKPNILFIMSDDQGYWSMGCAGNRDVKTPNLDMLAKNGIRFENFFCASPVCSPARASIMTGQMPSRHGIQDWIAEGHVEKSQLDDDLVRHFNEENREWFYDWPKNQLNETKATDYLGDRRCYTEDLVDAGYTCALSGKWHIGNAGIPQKGFTYWRALAMGGENYMYPVTLDPVTNKFTLQRETYVTDWITNNAIEFLDTHNMETPFYLQVNYTAPHAPWDERHHKPELWTEFEGCEFNDFPNEQPHKWSGMSFPSEEARLAQRLTWNRGYCASLLGMDLGIGQIIEHLKDLGVYDNTIIIFTSDNGMAMGHHGIFGKGNGTFPMNMYETSVKVPTIISMPDRKSGVCDSLLSHYDIMPTILELIDSNEKLNESLPGKSFLPILKDEEHDSHDMVVVHSEYGPARMIRTKEWKYIHRYPYGENELYDMVNDPNERNNLVGQKEFAVIISDLKYKMELWFDKHSDRETDGRLESNRGIGQVGPVGLKAKGEHSFR